MTPAIVSSRMSVALAICALLIYCAPAIAGPIAVISTIITLYYWAVCIVAVLSLIALWACRFVPDRRFRALIRLLIVVFIYTPVLWQGSLLPAFMLSPAMIFRMGAPEQARGIFAHPFCLSYGIALAVLLPLLMLYFHLRPPSESNSKP
jgi:hypothetical protein